MSEVSAEILAKLRTVNTDALWSTLRDLGYPHQFMAGLRVVRPELKMAGRALTLRYLPYRPDLGDGLVENRGAILSKRAVEEASPGDILVVDMGGDTSTTFIGDVITTAFLARGGAGIVCDGAVRDLAVLRTLDLPLYIKGAHAGALGAIMGVELNIPIRCAGVTVLPGDILLGDAQGVVAIPAKLAEKAAEDAAAQEEKEAFLRKVLMERKATIMEAYPPDERVQRMYEEYKKAHSAKE